MGPAGGRGKLLWPTAALFLFSLLLLPALRASTEGAPGYTGWKKCEACHSKIAAEWKTTRHADAFEHLKKTGQEELPNCVRCHSTGYDRAGGFIDAEITPGLAGVQCEACHGPGRQHAVAPAKESIAGAPGIETCRRCHTPGQDPGFDYGRKVKGVHRVR